MRLVMKQVTLNIPENKFAFFMQLVRSLNFIQVVDNEPKDKYDSEFVDRIQKSREEYSEGNFISVEKEDIKGFLGIE
ncbi:hypothetical protein DR864_14485 [Runella rosea]|uniref:Uncharacterized protein n=2 Tax=Runella rosea TaxID=2259595 RepID=A0A344TJP9_9BACT|nr:hypothetical protein DR864_14485 [Runella rosea]